MSDPTLDATPTTAMRPQDQVIYILGRIEGTVSSLNETVKSTAIAQAAVNASNEAEHVKFRETLSAHTSAIDGFTRDRADRQESKRETVQKWMVIAGVPAALVTCGGIIAWLLTAHP